MPPPNRPKKSFQAPNRETWARRRSRGRPRHPGTTNAVALRIAPNPKILQFVETPAAHPEAPPRRRGRGTGTTARRNRGPPADHRVPARTAPARSESARGGRIVAGRVVAGRVVAQALSLPSRHSCRLLLGTERSPTKKATAHPRGFFLGPSGPLLEIRSKLLACRPCEGENHFRRPGGL